MSFLKGRTGEKHRGGPGRGGGYAQGKKKGGFGNGIGKTPSMKIGREGRVNAEGGQQRSRRTNKEERGRLHEEPYLSKSRERCYSKKKGRHAERKEKGEGCEERGGNRNGLQNIFAV